MKKRFLKKASLLLASIILISGGLIMGFAEEGAGPGCPESTSGYKYEGNRKKIVCVQTQVEKGYWWFVNGEIKWVGTVFASMKGEYKEAVRETTYQGQEYSCDGFNYKTCWVCNCYYQNMTPTVTIRDI